MLLSSVVVYTCKVTRIKLHMQEKRISFHRASALLSLESNLKIRVSSQ
jgi:hypothetical protein